MGRIYSILSQDVNISCCGQDLCNGPPRQASSSYGPGEKAAAAQGTTANYLWICLATRIIMEL